MDNSEHFQQVKRSIVAIRNWCKDHDVGYESVNTPLHVNNVRWWSNIILYDHTYNIRIVNIEEEQYKEILQILKTTILVKFSYKQNIGHFCTFKGYKGMCGSVECAYFIDRKRCNVKMKLT